MKSDCHGYAHRKSLILLLCCAVMVTVLAGCRFPFRNPWSGRQGVGGNGQAQVVSPIDGLPTTEAAISRRPFAVMIENSPQARPQSGLDQADVVYEAITEGGITRFLAIYLQNDPPVIGPIRSARPHFINLEREYDAAYVHCGESYEALQILATTPEIFDLDQMKYLKPFRRDTSRRAPHNLYASAEKLRAQLQKLHWESAVPVLPQFYSDQRIANGTPARVIDIGFRGAVHYQLHLVYDAKMGGYLRYMDGKLHVDRETGQPLVAKNVLIQRVTAMPYPDDPHGTYDVTVIGNGIGQFFTSGQQLPMQWSKTDPISITKYTDAAGNTLPFQPGQTWVELVPVDGKVTVK